ncbi:MAG: MurR/RpiR family transcriptional regulator [Turicibacter sp.]|nr:MurR/RpiR family transcriptional regulator [Turicibacter sp.]
MLITEHQLQSLNQLERAAYDYIAANKDEVISMTIRDLSKSIHVSPTTILRMCKKLDIKGYSELKLRLKMFQIDSVVATKNQKLPDLDYLGALGTPVMGDKVNKAATLIQASKELILFGLGTSGLIARYAGHFYEMMGCKAQVIDDTYFHYTDKNYGQTIIIVISRSGETPHIINRVKFFKDREAVVIALTNWDNNSVALLSNLVISYQVPRKEISLSDVTTQIPALVSLEAIAHRFFELENSA